MRFSSVGSAFQFGGQRVSVRWAAHLISVHGAFLFGAQRVRFGVSEGWQVRFFSVSSGFASGGIIVLPSNTLFGEIRLSVKMQRVIEYDVEQCLQTAGMSSRFRKHTYIYLYIIE